MKADFLAIWQKHSYHVLLQHNETQSDYNWWNEEMWSYQQQVLKKDPFYNTEGGVERIRSLAVCFFSVRRGVWGEDTHLLCKLSEFQVGLEFHF